MNQAILRDWGVWEHGKNIQNCPAKRQTLAHATHNAYDDSIVLRGPNGSPVERDLSTAASDNLAIEPWTIAAIKLAAVTD